MAQLVSTVTVEKRRIGAGGEKQNHVKIVITNTGADTYGTGIALTAAQLGFARYVDSLALTDAGAGSVYVWKWDKAGAKLRAYEGDYAQAGDAGLVELDAADTPATATLYGVAQGY